MAHLFVDDLLIGDLVEEKLWAKHYVTFAEAWEVIDDEGHDARRGRDGLVAVYGRTDGGRPLLVVLAHVVDRIYRIVTARNVTDAERRQYFR